MLVIDSNGFVVLDPEECGIVPWDETPKGPHVCRHYRGYFARPRCTAGVDASQFDELSACDTPCHRYQAWNNVCQSAEYVPF